MSYKFESIFLKTLGELGVEFKAKQRVKSIKTNLWGPSCISGLDTFFRMEIGRASCRERVSSPV